MGPEAFAELGCFVALWLPQLCIAEAPPCSAGRIGSEIRHHLYMLSSLTVFDSIRYVADACHVTLTGYVTRPSLKSQAENSIKSIPGVEHVENRIEVLPVSSVDNALRLRVYRAVYEFPHLQKYALGVDKPIRIIVKDARVILEGVVDCEADRDIAGFRAKGIADVISVQNNLQLSSPQ